MDGLDQIKITVKYGHIQLFPAYKLDTDGSILMGGYAIHYDQNGNVEKRTPTEYYSRLTFE